MDRLIPYSANVYGTIVSDHNLSVWPLQIFVLVLCLSVIGLARRGGANNAALMIVAAFWIWCGVHFHIMTYATINWAAPYFGYAFIIQGMSIAVWAVMTRTQFIEPQRRMWVWAGIGLIISAGALHPLLLLIMSTPLSHAEVAGVMPTPTAILTIGILFLVPRRAALWLLIIPVAWSIWDGLSAWTLELSIGLVLPGMVIIAALGLIMSLMTPPNR